MTGGISHSNPDIRLAADLIRQSKHSVVLTGAGISTDSGIPDFRSDNSGLWARYDPFEVASLSAFRYHPDRFFAWMRPLVADILAASPNPAHLAITSLQKAGYVQTVITQNIDGLHHRAHSKNILEVHGTLRTLTCIGCFQQLISEDIIQTYLDDGEIPRCPNCRNILKPDVVLFEEQLPIRPWMMAQEACSKCDLIIVGGSSLEVMPVAGLPMRAVENKARLIIINRSPTYIDPRADLIFRQNITEILPSVVYELNR